MDERQRGRPLAIDHRAASASPTEPALVARPEGAPVYHGFVILDDVVVDGFTLGKLTDWEAEPCETGDAFVIGARRKSGRSCLGSLRSTPLPRGHAYRDWQMGSVGRRFSPANDWPRQCPQESRIYPASTKISVGGMEVAVPSRLLSRDCKQPVRALIRDFGGRCRKGSE